MTVITPAFLEDWLRNYYFNAEIDISSSGVENFSLAEIREKIGITQEEIDRVFFHDSETLGGLKLRQAIAQRWGNGDSEQVMATNGSTEAIFLIMHALLEADNEVIVIEPCYPALVNIAESIGCYIKRWHLSFEQQFIPNLEELKRLISPKTRMVIVNFPHNPTGASLTVEQQKELIKTISQVGAYLVWDAVFEEITYNTSPLPNVRFMYENAISIGTLSKAYGLPGLRVGWCQASPDILTRCIHWRDYTSICLSPLTELIAQRVIERADCLIDIRLRQAHTNLEILTEWFDRHQEFVQWVPPKGGVTVFPYFPDISNIEIFCRTLMKDYKVLLAPGTCFQHQNHARLGFGTSTTNLKEGLNRLSKLLNQSKGI